MDTITKAKNIITNSGHKLTEPRRELLEFLIREKDQHLTVEEIFNMLARNEQNIGIATLYRNMQLFEDLEIVSRLQLDDGIARYELKLDHEYDQHHHLICLDCNKLIEIKDPCDYDWVGDQYDFEIVNHVLKLYGYCCDCRER